LVALFHSVARTNLLSRSLPDLVEMCQSSHWHSDLVEMYDTHYNKHISTRSHMNTINVTPITRKAKNRFSNLMDENHTCTIEQVSDGMMFLTSQNKRNHFWVMLDNDPHWMLQ
jgi:hypothetical protein